VPLEFVVRAYITGVTKTSLWSNYEAGARNIAGNRCADVCLRLFARGTELAAQRGLILEQGPGLTARRSPPI
jgi:phosphoribosylaminoimidazole-succinocarboxamide synthase